MDPISGQVRERKGARHKPSPVGLTMVQNNHWGGEVRNVTVFSKALRACETTWNRKHVILYWPNNEMVASPLKRQHASSLLSPPTLSLAPTQNNYTYSGPRCVSKTGKGSSLQAKKDNGKPIRCSSSSHTVPYCTKQWQGKWRVEPQMNIGG